MKIRCAWHTPPKIMGKKEPLENEETTDGICDDCLARYFPTISQQVAGLNITEHDRYRD